MRRQKEKDQGRDEHGRPWSTRKVPRRMWLSLTRISCKGRILMGAKATLREASLFPHLTLGAKPWLSSSSIATVPSVSLGNTGSIRTVGKEPQVAFFIDPALPPSVSEPVPFHTPSDLFPYPFLGISVARAFPALTCSILKPNSGLSKYTLYLFKARAHAATWLLGT